MNLKDASVLGDWCIGCLSEVLARRVLPEVPSMGSVEGPGVLGKYPTSTLVHPGAPCDDTCAPWNCSLVL